MADGLLNKASIILTPTGYKAGTLYNVAPIDEPYEDFDFARASVASRVNSSGLVSNVATGVPRINYDSNGDNGHILLEPTSTNLVTYSEDFSQWSTTNATTTQNVVTSPDGTVNANKIIATSTTGQHRVNFTSSNTSGSTTFSFFAKSAEYNSCWARIGLDSGFFDLENGLTSANVGITSSIVDYGNGWYKCIITKASSNANEVCRINVTTSYTTTADFSGDNTSGIYVYGAQHEQLSYATSYIPTLTGSTVTRATETATGAGSSTLINSTEGVLYAEIAALADDGTNRCIALSDGTADDRVTLVLGDDSNKIRAIVKSNGSTSFDEEYTVTSTLDYHKVAIKYKANDFALWIDGVERFTDTSGSAPIGLNELAFDTGISILNFYGKCKALAVFNEALSDDELTQLTT